jgi:hypothetical protein
MWSKPDITTAKLANWDQYKAKPPDEVLASVYLHIEAVSRQMCSWYWASIRTKRITSQLVRALSFVLLIFGTTLPLFAALQATAEQKLLMTQVAVALLAMAGLTQVADRVFGWSSGWMRYVTTVTTMENLVRAFQMEWARFLVAKAAQPDAADAKALFDLAKSLEQELTTLQADETTKWVAEFNTGIALLDTLIKTQREEADKKLDAIRTSLMAQEATAKAEEKARLPGAIEVSLGFKAEPKKAKIGLDDDPLAEFVGSVWTKPDVAAGLHVVRVLTTTVPAQTTERMAEVKPGAIARLDVAVGE